MVVVADEDGEQANLRQELRTRSSRLKAAEKAQDLGVVGPAEEEGVAISRTAAPLIRIPGRSPVDNRLKGRLQWQKTRVRRQLRRPQTTPMMERFASSVRQMSNIHLLRRVIIALAISAR